MVELTHQDLSGSRFEDVDLSGSLFRNLLLRDVRITGAWIENVEIDADIERGLTVNGVDVVPYVHAELNRRHPGREEVVAVRTGDADTFRAAWAIDQRAWGETVARARKLPEELLHEQVGGEWSFIQTLRHLLMATESWVLRTVLGDPSPYQPLSLPFSEMGDIPGVPNDPDARPSLDEVLALRADRMATVSEVIAALTDEQLEGMTEPNPASGYPETGSYPVRRCLAAILLEEWEHHLFANRDLAVLEER